MHSTYFKKLVCRFKRLFLSSTSLTLLTIGLLYSLCIADLHFSCPFFSISSETISTEAAIETLLKEYQTYPQVKQILSHLSSYPSSLLQLAARNPETIDFVALYPEYKSKNAVTPTLFNRDPYLQNAIPLFLQWDTQWGYTLYGDDFLAVNGCGPTALSMVTVGLTGHSEFTPLAVANFCDSSGYYINGQGTSWTLMNEGAQELGLKSQDIPLKYASIISELKKHHPLIASMKPGHFTTEGHFIVLAGIAPNGQIIVNDPSSLKRSLKTWDLSLILEECKHLWSFSVL